MLKGMLSLTRGPFSALIFLAILAIASTALASPSAAPPERTRDLRARVELNPLDTLAHNELGVALAGSGDLESARRHLWFAVIVDDSLVDAWANLGLVQRKLRAHKAAIAAFGKALSLKVEQPELWYSAGASLRALRDDAASLFALEAFMTHAPASHPKRAKVTRVIDKWKAAGITPRAPEWPPPAPPEARVREIAEVAAEAQRRAAQREAARVAKASAPLAPKAATSHPSASALPRHGGDSAFEAKHYVKALRDYESEAMIRPSDGVLLYKLGATRAILGDPTGALRAWRRVIEQTPARLILNRQIAFATRRLADWGMTETTRQIDDEDVVGIARAALLADDPADVLLITEGSKELEALFLRGEAALQLGQLEIAWRAFENGLVIAPDDRGMRGGRIEVLIRQGRAEAEEAAQQWLDDMESTTAAFLAERALIVARRIRYGSTAVALDDEFDDELD